MSRRSEAVRTLRSRSLTARHVALARTETAGRHHRRSWKSRGRSAARRSLSAGLGVRDAAAGSTPNSLEERFGHLGGVGDEARLEDGVLFGWRHRFELLRRPHLVSHDAQRTGQTRDQAQSRAAPVRGHPRNVRPTRGHRPIPQPLIRVAPLGRRDVDSSTSAAGGVCRESHPFELRG